MTTQARGVAAALGALLLAGCGRAAPTGPLHRDGLTVTFAPDPPLARRPDRICVAGVDGAVTVRMWMTAMSMGPVPGATLRSEAGGPACGSVLFVMEGRWELELALSGGRSVGPLPVEVGV